MRLDMAEDSSPRAAARWTSWERLALGVLGLQVSLVFALYLMGATANTDDLIAILYVAPGLDTTKGLLAALKMVFLNEDVGQTELRTYGFARFLQILHLWVFGKSQVAPFVTMLLVHAASAVGLYAALRRVLERRQGRLILSLIWLVSPAVLPVERVLHHFLYIMLPYYLLIAWIALVSLRSDRTLLGAVLLVLANLSGEAAIPTTYLTVLLFGIWASRSGRPDVVRSSVIQVAVALTALVAYVAYQRIFVHDPRALQRVGVGFPQSWPELEQRLTLPFEFLWQNVLALAGRPFFDGELGREAHVGGLSYVGGWPFALTLVVAIIALLVSVRLRQPRASRAWLMALAVLLVSVSTLTLYLAVFLASGSLPLTTRYVPPIFSAVLIAVPLALLLIAPRFGTLIAGAVAAVCLASTTGLLVEIYGVRQRIDQRLAWAVQQRQMGRDAILIAHTSPPIDSTRIPYSLWPGLGGGFDYFAADPFRSYWTTAPFLKLYSGYSFVALSYRELDDSTVELTDGQSKLVIAKDKVAVGGLSSKVFPTEHAEVILYRDWSDFARSPAAKK